VPGARFSVSLELSPSVQVQGGDFVALFQVGRLDFDIGSRWYLVTADRLEDGFHWEARGWGDTLAWAQQQLTKGTEELELELEFRYFRRSGKGGPIFVSPTFHCADCDPLPSRQSWAQSDLGNLALPPSIDQLRFSASLDNMALHTHGSARSSFDAPHRIGRVRCHSVDIPTSPSLRRPPSTPRHIARAAVQHGFEDSTAGLERVDDPRDVGISARRLQHVSSWMKNWVDSGKLPGMSTAIMRHGKLAYMRCYGQRDVDAGKAMQPDTIVRIYSMSKPIVSVAAMILYERGEFQLDESIARHMPEFAQMRVYQSGTSPADLVTTGKRACAVAGRPVDTVCSPLAVQWQPRGQMAYLTGVPTGNAWVSCRAPDQLPRPAHPHQRDLVRRQRLGGG
jgi:hypothetical protein